MDLGTTATAVLKMVLNFSPQQYMPICGLETKTPILVGKIHPQPRRKLTQPALHCRSNRNKDMIRIMKSKTNKKRKEFCLKRNYRE